MSQKNTQKSVPLDEQIAADAEFDLRMEQVTLAIDRYHQYLVEFVYSRTRQWQEAEDIVSDLWRYVIKHVNLDKICNLKVLRAKAHFLFLDWYRRQKNREILSEGFYEMPIAASPDGPETDAEIAACEKRFWAEFPEINLTENQKKALLLNVYGYTLKDIGKQLGTAQSTVGDWVKKAKSEVITYFNSRRT